MAEIILHNLRSARNVGSIFRTADAADISKVYLTGYTPLPLDRFGRLVKEVHKTALGAEATVPWEHANIQRLLKKLKKENKKIAALEQNSRSVDYRKARGAEPLVVMVGNEVRGISPALLKHCDDVYEIPMSGKKESLNVAVAVGVFLFRLRDR